MTTGKKKLGWFITLEGVEGTGKSSAIDFIKQQLPTLGWDAVVTREPGGTPIAESIRHVLLHAQGEVMANDTELLLMFAGRAQHLAQVIRPALEKGQVVISDRFTDATYAYQGGGRGISKERIAILENWVQGGLEPNLTLLLDAPLEVCLSRILTRGMKDRIEQEQLDFFERVRTVYLQRAELFPNRFKVIDTTQPIKQIHEQILQTLTQFMHSSTR